MIPPIMRLIIFFIFFFSSSLFASSLDDMKQLYQKAEFAMQKKNYAEAKEAYTQLLKMNISPYVDMFTYADITIRLSLTESKLGMSKEAEKRLVLLFQKPLPDDLFLNGKVLYAKLRQEQGATEEAFAILTDLKEKLPTSKWPLEELSYYLGIKQLLKDRLSTTLGQAKRLFDASLYQESANLYQDVLENINLGRLPVDDKEESTLEVLYLLARSHFECGNTAKVIALLQPKWFEWKRQNAKIFSKDEQKILFLLAKTYKEIGNFNEQIACLQLLKGAPQSEEALFELGSAHLKMGNTLVAKECFQKILEGPGHPKTTQLARLYLSKLFLKEKTPAPVAALLDPLLSVLPPQDPLKYEIYYLQGEAAFQLGDFAKAALLFEQSIPKQNREKAVWANNALYAQGWSFLKLAEDKNQTLLRSEYFTKAEKAFKEVMKSSALEEKGALSLGRLYQIKGAFKELEELFSKPNLFTTLENQAEALLIRADAQSSPDLKASFYKQLTEMKPLNTTMAGKRGWYFRGVQLYLNAEEAGSLHQYKNAGDLLTTAFEELKECDQEIAFLAKLFASKSYYFAKDPRALQLLDELMAQESSHQGSKQDEVLYFHALTCIDAFQRESDEALLKKAELSVLQLTEKFPESSYTDKILFLLATTYFEGEIYDRAHSLFSLLAKNFPDSSFAAESLFWAAESIEKGEDTEDVASVYRKSLYEDHPQCPYAAESYFRLYSFAEYLNGDETPLQHLKQMKVCFPHSPFLIVSHYLLGMESKDPLIFEETTLLFDQNLKENKIPQEHFDYFVHVYYRAKLEQALIYLSLLDEQEGAARVHIADLLVKKLNEIINDFSQDDQPLTKKMLAECGYPRIYEESDFLLGKALIKIGRSEDAKEHLNTVLKKYETRCINKGYYLATNLVELGKFYMRENEPLLALNTFKRAEMAGGSNLLLSEQKLDIWMDESACLKSLRRYDEAMLMLSHVINENASSSLRIKAMLQRADLYALQGRHELAIKQLEAVTKKGGDFAHLAKDRLRSEYGF